MHLAVVESGMISTGELYSNVSQLRQAQDFQWLLDMLPAKVQRYADLCCGSGLLIRRMIEEKRVSEVVVGVDHSISMLRAAEKNLESWPVTFLRASLDDEPRMGGGFDLMTMTSALHWFHPRETTILGWVREHLAQDGLFCFTTYHPTSVVNGYGGTDMLVRRALERMGLDPDFGAEQIPMGTRTIPVRAIHEMLVGRFTIEKEQQREAVMRVDTPGQYVDYHQATFGSYYTELVEASRRDELLEQLGREAMTRMSRYGYVTKMKVVAHLAQAK